VVVEDIGDTPIAVAGSQSEQRRDAVGADSPDAGTMDSALTDVILDVRTTPGDILVARMLDVHQNPVSEPEQVRTNADVERLREHYGLAEDAVRCSPEVRRILDVNSLE
jgi:hypothetical protein